MAGSDSSTASNMSVGLASNNSDDVNRDQEVMEVEQGPEVYFDPTNLSCTSKDWVYVDPNPKLSTTPKVKKQVQISSRAKKDEYERTLQIRILIQLPKADKSTLDPRKREENQANAQRKLKDALRLAESMAKKKNPEARELVLYPWNSTAQKDGRKPKPLNIDQLGVQGWDDKGIYYHAPSNVNYITEVWLRVYMGIDYPLDSHGSVPKNFAMNWVDRHLAKKGTELKISTDVLQTESTTTVGYFHSFLVNMNFDLPAFNKCIVRAIGIPVSVHAAHVGYINETTGQLVLTQNERAGDKLLVPIKGYHVEVASLDASQATKALLVAFNPSKTKHPPMQVRAAFIPTNTKLTKSREMLLALAMAHHEYISKVKTSPDLRHITRLDEPLIQGQPPDQELTLRKILGDVSAAYLDSSPRANMLDQVNTSHLGFTQFVYHESQQNKTDIVSQYLYAMLTASRRLFVKESEDAEFDESLRRCLSVDHIQANESVVFDPSTGVFTSQTDESLEAIFQLINAGAAGTQGGLVVSARGGDSVTSAISTFTHGAISTTSAATKSKLRQSLAMNAKLEQDMEEMRQRAEAKDQEFEEMKRLLAQLANSAPPPSQSALTLTQTGITGDAPATPETVREERYKQEASSMAGHHVNEAKVDDTQASPGLDIALLKIKRAEMNEELKKRYQHKARGRSLTSSRSKSSGTVSVRKHNPKGSKERERGRSSSSSSRKQSAGVLLNRQMDGMAEQGWEGDDIPDGLLDESAITKSDSVESFSTIAETENEVDLTFQSDSAPDLSVQQMEAASSAPIPPTIAIDGGTKDAFMAASAGPGSNGPAQGR